MKDPDDTQNIAHNYDAAQRLLGESFDAFKADRLEVAWAKAELAEAAFFQLSGDLKKALREAEGVRVKRRRGLLG